MSDTKCPALLMPTLRYWLGKGRDFARRIRIEWVDRENYVRTAYGVLPWNERGYCSLKWMYDEPPRDLDVLALECILDDNEHGITGCELVGYEDKHEMSAACDPEDWAPAYPSEAAA